MINLFDRIVLPLLRNLEPENAHTLILHALNFASLMPGHSDDARLTVRAFGLNFPNPIGMAAGFDKNGQVPDALLRLGFGFVEVGTVTPKPQPGNERPRLFRLETDDGVINRFGFNSDGAAKVLARLAARAHQGGIVGVNIGANKITEDRGADYVHLIESFAPVASYFTVNISSPNTPGLRDLQKASALDDLLVRIVAARERMSASAGPVPILVKIAPDVSLSELDDIVAIARRRQIDGMIISNTTIGRPKSLRDATTAQQTGGLSGRPIFPIATRILAETFVRAEGAFPLVGVGGIDSGSSALAKIRAGASLIQLYSGLVFRGLDLLSEIKATFIEAINETTTGSLSELVGCDAAEITAEPWPE